MKATFAVAVAMGLLGGAFGATNEYTVAAGVTKTFAQMESELGVTLAAGDTIVKKGPGTLQATKDAKYKIKYEMIVEEGVFEVPDGVTNDQKGTLTVKKGGCLYIHDNSVAFKEWTFYVEGEGTGTAPFLGAVVIGATTGNGQTNHGTWNLTDDTTFYTWLGGKGNVCNYVFSGNSASSGPTVNMNSHTLTIKGDGMKTMFRPRWHLKLRTTGTIIGDNIFCARHQDGGGKEAMDDYNPYVPLFKLVNGAMLSVDGYFHKKVSAFEFEHGTSLGKNDLGGGVANTALYRIVGCPTITKDATIGCSELFTVKGSDLAAGHCLTSVNVFTFVDGCLLSATELDAAGLVAGKTYTVATSDAAIDGTPTLTGFAADVFTVANTGKALTLTVKDGLVNAVVDGGLLPGEENAQHNTDALAAFAAGVADGAVIYFPTGDYYFAGDFDLSAMTAKNVTLVNFERTAAIRATLRMGAAENAKVSGLVFKGCEGPAIVAAGTAGLKVADCVLDGVVGAYTDEKKYPFVAQNVTDFEVTNPLYRNVGFNWDLPALLDGGSQTEASRVRAGELVAYVDAFATDTGGDRGWAGWGYITNRNGLAKSAYNGLKLRKTGGGTLDPDCDLAGIGVTGMEIVAGQFVSRGDSNLGVAKEAVVVHDGASLTLAGSVTAAKSRTITIEGTGTKADTPAVRFTGTSMWNKTDTVTWNLAGDATMYDNVGNVSNGSFLWGGVKMNGHTLTLTGKSNGAYRFGRSFTWYGGGTMVVKGVAITASPVTDKATTPSFKSYVVKDGSSPKFVFRDKAKFTPDTCELAGMMNDLDFATPDCTFGINANTAAMVPHNFTFRNLAGAPTVNDAVLSVTVTNGYAAHVADLQNAKTLKMAGKFGFAKGATAGLDDPAAMPVVSGAQPLLVTAAGGMTGSKPHADAATAAVGWHVKKDGTSLYLCEAPGAVILVK